MIDTMQEAGLGVPTEEPIPTDFGDIEDECRRMGGARSSAPLGVRASRLGVCLRYHLRTEMIVDFTQPASIRLWLKVAPDRHRAQLRALWRLWPALRGQIEEAAR